MTQQPRPAPEHSGPGLDISERAGSDTLYAFAVESGVAPATGVPESPLTLSSAIDSFLFHCRYEKNLSPKTLKAYATDLRQFEQHVTQVVKKNLEVASIDKHVVRSFVQALAAQFAEESTRRKIATLNGFFGHLEREDVLTVNPLRKLSIRLRRTHRLPRTIPLKELRLLFHHLYALRNTTVGAEHGEIVRDIAIVEVLFATAARVAEIAHLRVADVDVEQGVVRVLGKGRRERVLPLGDASAAHAIRNYLDILPPFSAADYLFRNRRNNRFSEASIRRMLQCRGREAGIQGKLTPHMFRHSVATMLLEEGVDIRLIQTVLGHSSVVTTQIYTAVHDSFQKKVLADHHPRRRI